MLLFLVLGGAGLAVICLIGKLFVPHRMHAGYDRGIRSLFLNVMRLSIIGLLMIGVYAALEINGVLK